MVIVINSQKAECLIKSKYVMSKKFYKNYNTDSTKYIYAYRNGAIKYLQERKRQKL